MTSSTAAEIFADFLARMDSGEIPDFDALLNENPDRAADLRGLFAEEMARLEGSGRELIEGILEQRLPQRASERVALSTDSRTETALEFTAKVMEQLSAYSAPFGRYTVQGEIGKGGMGAVLRVWDENMRRHLAMKVILEKSRPGLAPGSKPAATPDSAPVDPIKLARFLIEAQVTGELDHPGIVPVHELGLDPEGRVYFTMKLVEGQTLGEVLALVRDGREGWTQARALNVLHKVCEAMAYAHDKGVIHRDLKPTNVMVGKFGEVYVMDWGLARIVGREDHRDIRLHAEPLSGKRSELEARPAKERGSSPPTHNAQGKQRGATSDAPLYTLDGEVVGTPAYMPPEQALGKVDEIGPHSDVYAVGAMIYHLLAGHMPYVPSGSSLDNRAVWKNVRQGPPTPLQDAAPRAAAELAAICEKAMARDWKQRYRDMTEMAADVSSFLEGRVVRAHETGAWATARKWVQRNRGLGAALATAVLLLIVGLVASLTLKAQSDANFLRAEKNMQAAYDERQRAVDESKKADANAQQAAEERDRALKIASFLEETLKGVDPAIAVGRDTTVLQEMMSAAVARLESGELAAAPEAEIRLLTVIGFTYHAIARYDKAEPILRKAVEKARAFYRADDPQLATTLNAQALLLRDRGELASAEPLAREVLEMRKRLYPGDHVLVAQSLGNLGGMLQTRNDLAGAEALYRESLEMDRRLFSGADERIAMSISNLAMVLENRGDSTAAEPLFREALAMRSQLFHGDNPELARSLDNLAGLLHSRGELAEAEPLMRRSLEMRKRLFVGDHVDVATSLNNLSGLLMERGDAAEAENLCRQALEMQRRLFPGDHSHVAVSLQNLASMLRMRGDLAGAESLCREALEMQQHLFKGDHADVAYSLFNLAMILQSRGNTTEAETLCREALEMKKRISSRDDPDLARVIQSVGLLVRARGDYVQAEQLIREALRMLRATLPESHMSVARAAISLGHCLSNEKRYAEAEEILLPLSTQLLGNPSSPASMCKSCIDYLVANYTAWDQAEPGKDHAARAEDWKQKLAEREKR